MRGKKRAISSEGNILVFSRLFFRNKIISSLLTETIPNNYFLLYKNMEIYSYYTISHVFFSFFNIFAHTLKRCQKEVGWWLICLPLIIFLPSYGSFKLIYLLPISRWYILLWFQRLVYRLNTKFVFFPVKTRVGLCGAPRPVITRDWDVRSIPSSKFVSLWMPPFTIPYLYPRSFYTILSLKPVYFAIKVWISFLMHKNQCPS